MQRMRGSGILRFCLLAAVFVAGMAVERGGLVPAILRYQGDIVYLVPQHIELAAVSGGLAILVGVPLGVFLTRRRFRWLAAVVGQLLNLGTTIPTLAILALAMTVLGIGARSAIFGLFCLTLLPIVINTVAGLRAVPPHLIEAARGIGLSPAGILMQVQLPNAAFVIVSGIRTALAINIGTVPLAFLVGGGGLGELIFSGIDLMEPGMLLAGAVPTAVLAVIVDYLVGLAQYWLIPRGVNPLR